jgi:hypothetical protein
LEVVLIRFRAKMYKSRISKWGLDKNIKEAEAWAVLGIKMQRDVIGKNSIFRVRGKCRTVDDVLRYFKRKGILDPESAQPPEYSTPPPEIECWTPQPSPKPGFSTIQIPEGEQMQLWSNPNRIPDGAITGETRRISQDFATSFYGNHVYLTVDRARQALFSNPEIQSFEIPRSPLPPQNLLVSEKLFSSIKSYYEGAVATDLFEIDEDGTLAVVDDAKGRSQVDDFYNLCLIGVNLMSSKLFFEGRRYFSKASGLVCQIIRTQHPETLQILLAVVRWLRIQGYPEIANSFRNLASSIAMIAFTEEHAWRQIFFLIANLDDSQLDLALAEAWRCLCDTLANLLGQFHSTTTSCWLAFIIELHESNAPELLRDFLLREEQDLERFDEALLTINFKYGQALYRNSRHDEAIAIFEEVLSRARETSGLEVLVVETIQMISLCHCGRGHGKLAESTMRQGIEEAEKMYNNSSSLALSMKRYLQQWLFEWGREAESAALIAELDEIIGPEDIKIEILSFEG